VSEALARLDGCGAEAELAALARECLAADPGQRPRDAGEVATRVTAYREAVQQRLRQAELGRAAAQARALGAHKRPRLTLALAGSVILALGLGGGGAWYLRQQYLERQTEEARRAAEKALKEAELTRRIDADLAEAVEAQAREKWDRGWAALERAEGR